MVLEINLKDKKLRLPLAKFCSGWKVFGNVKTGVCYVFQAKDTTVLAEVLFIPVQYSVGNVLYAVF